MFRALVPLLGAIRGWLFGSNIVRAHPLGDGSGVFVAWSGDVWADYPGWQEDRVTAIGTQYLITWGMEKSFLFLASNRIKGRPIDADELIRIHDFAHRHNVDPYDVPIGPAGTE